MSNLVIKKRHDTQSDIALRIMNRVDNSIAYVPPSGPKGTYLTVFDPETHR